MPGLTLLSPLGRVFGRLRTDRRAVALVEFAFGFPLLFLVISVGLETANYTIVHLRASQIALTTADNAARVRIQIDESNVNQLFQGDKDIGKAIDFADRGQVILSSVEPNGEKKKKDQGQYQYIRWQRCFGDLDKQSAYGAEGKGKEDNSLQFMGKDDQKIAAAEGTAVMFVEVYYKYKSLFPNSPLDGQIIHYESAMNVRERTNQEISNSAGVAPATC